MVPGGAQGSLTPGENNSEDAEKSCAATGLKRWENHRLRGPSGAGQEMQGADAAAQAFAGCDTGCSSPCTSSLAEGTVKGTSPSSHTLAAGCSNSSCNAEESHSDIVGKGLDAERGGLHASAPGSCTRRGAPDFQRRDSALICSPRRRRTAGSTAVDEGEGRAGTSPTVRGVRTDVVSPLSVCDPTLSTLDSRTGGRSLAQWVAHHSVSDTSFRAAFVPCVRPVATAVSAARFLTSVRKLDNSCWLEHGHPGTGEQRP